MNQGWKLFFRQPESRNFHQIKMSVLKTTGRLKTLIELTVNQVWKWQIDGTALNSSGTRGTAGGFDGVSEPQGLYCLNYSLYCFGMVRGRKISFVISFNLSLVHKTIDYPHPSPLQNIHWMFLNLKSLPHTKNLP